MNVLFFTNLLERSQCFFVLSFLSYLCAYYILYLCYWDLSRFPFISHCKSSRYLESEGKGLASGTSS